MSAPTISWNVDTPTELYVNLTGTLVPDAAGTKGSIWSGNAGSPSGRWRINLDDACYIAKTANPTLPYDQHMGNVVASQNYGPAETFDIYASGFGTSSFAPTLTAPQYSPRLAAWKFQFAKRPAGSGPVPPGWIGSYELTIFLPRKLSDFAQWRYNMDIVIVGP